MFELIILITFMLWCVFGVLLLKNTRWNLRKIVVGKIKR
jgi:hypothetical protein